MGGPARGILPLSARGFRPANTTRPTWVDATTRPTWVDETPTRAGAAWGGPWRGATRPARDERRSSPEERRSSWGRGSSRSSVARSSPGLGATPLRWPVAGAAGFVRWRAPRLGHGPRWPVPMLKRLSHAICRPRALPRRGRLQQTQRVGVRRCAEHVRRRRCRAVNADYSDLTGAWISDWGGVKIDGSVGATPTPTAPGPDVPGSRRRATMSTRVPGASRRSATVR
jgi:hypothetical protein